jgi:hypothetical protein
LLDDGTDDWVGNDLVDDVTDLSRNSRARVNCPASNVMRTDKHPAFHAHHVLQMGHEIVEIDERELGLEMSELGEMSTVGTNVLRCQVEDHKVVTSTETSPSSVAVLGSEALLNTEHISERGQTGLEVQLGGLSEEGLLTVVVELEETASTLDTGLYHARWSHFEDGLLVVAVSER